MDVVKRDGQLEEFNINKIRDAIVKAARKVGQDDLELATSMSMKVSKELRDSNLEIYDVDIIHDTVERVLMDNEQNRIAKEYILYRDYKSRVRKSDAGLMKEIEEITFSSSSELDVKRENANIDADTPMGTMLKYGSETAKRFNLLSLVSSEASEAHRCGDIHIHDLDFLALTATCCQIDLDRLFKSGFCTGHGFLRAPNSIGSYSALACIALQSNQNDMHKRVA